MNLQVIGQLLSSAIILLAGPIVILVLALKKVIYNQNYNLCMKILKSPYINYLILIILYKVNKKRYNRYNQRVVSSVVERLPYKQMVTGSNPVPPINK